MSLVFESLGQLSDHLVDRGVQVVDPGVPLESLVRSSDDLWLQPSVRKVVGFIARNVASIPLHTYERVSDTDRVRVRDHDLSRVMSSPAPRTTAYRFWELVLIDWLLHDRWCVMKLPADVGGGVQLARVPVRRFRFKSDGLDRVTSVQLYQESRWVDHDPDGFLFDHGYADRGANGTSPAETLKQILAEGAEAVAYRRGVWKNGARVPAVIERPLGAPPWSTEAKGRFKQSWQNFVRGGGREGGTPILEDGMKLVETKAFSPQDAQDLEGRKLTDVEVATSYFVAPELLGIREGTYSNVEAFRQALYRDALGPYIDGWVGTINAQLTPDLAGGRDLYVEAHMEAKLRGSFEEQAAILSTATGRPWMVTDEARGRMNLPALGGDAELLVTPLNVTLGGLASPRDTGDQNRGTASDEFVGRSEHERKFQLPVAQGKALEEGLSGVARERAALEADLEVYQQRLASRVLSGLGAKAAGPLDEAFDLEQADEELRRLLAGRSRRIAQAGAGEVLEEWNPEAEGWSPDVMDPWLAKASESNANRMNRGLYDRLAEVVVGPEWEDAARGVLLAAGWAALWAVTVGTESASFGRQDAAQASGLGTKTWRTTSGNPRPSHAALDGVTIPVDAVFAVGGRWPGDPFQPVEENAGCQCVLEYGRGDG